MTCNIHSLLLLFFSFLSLLGLFLQVLPLDSSGSSTSEWRLEREVNVLLRVKSDNERWDIDNLFPHADVSLSDEDSGMMDTLGKAMFEDLCLESSFHKVFNAKTKDVIELHSRLLKDTNSYQSSKECITFKESSRILFIKSEKFSSSLPNLGKGVLDSPYLSFVFQSILSD